MQIMRRYIRFACWLILTCIFVIACGPQLPPKPQHANQTVSEIAGSRGGTAVYRLQSAPTTFNYLMAADESSVLLAFYLLQSRIIDFDNQSQTYIPAIAESWQVSPDGLTVDLKLREDAKFSDGQPVTADDVVFTLNAVYDEHTNSPSFRDALSISGKPIKAASVDNFNVRLALPEKVASVENYLVNIAILPEHILKPELDSGKMGEAWKLSTDPAQIVTSGAFAVESVVPGESITLVRNSHYWKKDSNETRLPYLDKLVLEIVGDPNNTLVQLSQNTIDIADRIRPSDYADLAANPGEVKTADAGPVLGVDHMWFNLNRARHSGEKLDDKPKFLWFNDTRFRRAVSFAIDRNTIASITMRGLATPVYGIVSPANHVWADPNLAKTEYDLEKSRQLLNDAGFSSSGTPEAPELLDANGNRVEFTLLVPAENEPRRLMAAAIQADLTKLGIKMQVVPLEFQNVTERWAKTFDYDAVLLGLSATDTEPSSFANFLVSSAGTHHWHPEQRTPATDWEAQIDKLFVEQSREGDQEKRKAMFYKIQEILADQMPVIPIVSRHIVSAANKRIGNFSPTGILPYSLWNADRLFIIQ
jgi:peptide/nickel transport system substrate-binding protein